MAFIINEIIPEQNFEIVENAIGAILTEELTQQKILQPERLTEDVTVFKERITAVDKTEEVVIIVAIDSISSEYKAQNSTQERTNYFIDVYANGKAKGDIPGDDIAGSRVLKYIGLCRYILESHQYVTLGLPPGSIGGKSVDNIQMYEQQNTQDTNFGRMCRINFSVRIMENTALWEGILLKENLTNVTLNETNKGYQFKLKQ